MVAMATVDMLTEEDLVVPTVSRETDVYFQMIDTLDAIENKSNMLLTPQVMLYPTSTGTSTRTPTPSPTVSPPRCVEGEATPGLPCMPLTPTRVPTLPPFTPTPIPTCAVSSSGAIVGINRCVFPND